MTNNNENLMKTLNNISPEEANYRAAILKEGMLKWQVQNNRNQTKWLAYVNSTSLRLHFSNWLFHAYYTGRKVTASTLTIEIGCSRKSMDEMINDWFEEKWLTKEKGTGSDSNKYYLHVTEIPLSHQQEWFDWYTEQVIPMRSKSYRSYEARIERDKIKDLIKFDTTTTTNIRGIDNKVSSFIVNSTKRVNGGE